MKYSKQVFEYFRYNAPMPLVNTLPHYFYCATQGLPPLPPPRKKKVQTRRTNNNTTNNTSTPPTAVATTIVSTMPTTPAPTPTVIVQRVHWPDDLDTHQVVEFNKVDAKFANNIGSPFEGE